MAELTLEDLSKEELLALFKRVAMFSVGQRDLLRVRWDALVAGSSAAGKRACELSTIAAEKAAVLTKAKGAHQIIIARAEYLAAHDASMKAQRAWDRALAKAEAAYVALDKAGG